MHELGTSKITADPGSPSASVQSRESSCATGTMREYDPRGTGTRDQRIEDAEVGYVSFDDADEPDAWHALLPAARSWNQSGCYKWGALRGAHADGSLDRHGVGRLRRHGRSRLRGDEAATGVHIPHSWGGTPAAAAGCA